MKKLSWTNGRVAILSLYSFALGVGTVFLIDDAHAGAVGVGDITGMLVVTAVLVVIIAGAARDPDDEESPGPIGRPE